MRQRFARVHVVLFDGTLFTDDEMIRTHNRAKATGRPIGHMPIEGEGGPLHAFDGLSARRIFIHINNTNPILIEAPLSDARSESAGWQVAEDGMEIVL